MPDSETTERRDWFEVTYRICKRLEPISWVGEVLWRMAISTWYVVVFLAALRILGIM